MPSNHTLVVPGRRYLDRRVFVEQQGARGSRMLFLFNDGIFACNAVPSIQPLVVRRAHRQESAPTGRRSRGARALTLMRRACSRSVSCAVGVEVQGLAAVAHA